jgi:holo-[acyl-carrier protein] synthase
MAITDHVNTKTIGVDLIETKRLKHTITRFGDRFLRRIYTDQELSYCQGRVSSLAARWAAKEAAAKALGTGIGMIHWQDIEVVNNNNYRPTLHLYGNAAELAARLGVAQFAVSLSHTKEYAVAFVVGD